MKKTQQLLDVTFWKFVLVGIANTLVGTTVAIGFHQHQIM